MMFLQAFRMSIKAISENKIRSSLTMFGIIIGVAAVMTLVSIVSGFSRAMEEDMKSYGTNIIYVNCWMTSGRTLAQDLEVLVMENSDLFVGITPEDSMWQQAIKYKAKTYTTARLQYANKDFSTITNYTIESGRDLSYLDVAIRNRVVVIGSRVKEKLFNYKNPIGETVYIANNAFTVVGIYESKRDNYEYSDDDIYIVPYTLKQLINKSSAITNFRAKAVDTSKIDKAKGKLDAFMNSYMGGNFSTYADSSGGQIVDEQVNNLKLLGAILGSISLLVGGVGIMNIMLVTVTERTREIGVRKAIGAERRSIIAQFLIESGVISACGGLFGIFLGIMATLVVGKMVLQRIIFPDFIATLISVAVSVLWGVICGLYPAIKASSLQPVIALRSE